MCTGATWRSQWKLSFVRCRRRRRRRSTCSFASIDILWSNAVFVFASNCRWLRSAADPPPLHTTSFFRFLVPPTLPLSLFPTFSLCLSLSISFFSSPLWHGVLGCGCQMSKCWQHPHTSTHTHTQSIPIPAERHVHVVVISSMAGHVNCSSKQIT